MKITQHIIICLLISVSAFAQDVIIKTDGIILNVKISSVDTAKVVFEKKQRNKVKTGYVLITEVDRIKYANGSNAMYKKGTLLDSAYYVLGITDAKKYYKTKQTFVGGFISGALLPFGGFIIGPIICSSEPHNLVNEKNPNNNLISSNFSYNVGFKERAKSKKVGRGLLGFTIGVATFIGAVALYIETQPGGAYLSF